MCLVWFEQRSRGGLPTTLKRPHFLGGHLNRPEPILETPKPSDPPRPLPEPEFDGDITVYPPLLRPRKKQT